MIADTCTVCEGLFWVFFSEKYTHICSIACQERFDEAAWKQEEE